MMRFPNPTAVFAPLTFHHVTFFASVLSYVVSYVRSGVAFSAISCIFLGVAPMPTFRSSLPPEGKHVGFDLRRTPVSAPLRAICTCPAFLVCDTHYWRGRTTPCERITNEEGKTIDDSPCQACTDKIPFRTHCYVSCFDAKKAEHFLFECTANAAKAFDDYIKGNGTLRGCGFSASRAKCTPNGKVLIETSPVNLSRMTLPEPPDIIKALSVIWRLPLKSLSIEAVPFSPPVVKTVADELAKSLRQEDNALPDMTPEQFAERKRDFTSAITKTNGKPKRVKEPA